MAMMSEKGNSFFPFFQIFPETLPPGNFITRKTINNKLNLTPVH